MFTSLVSNAWDAQKPVTLAQAEAILEAEVTVYPDQYLEDDSYLLAKCPIVIGPAGVGKSSMIRQVCKRMGYEFGRVQLGAGVMEDNVGLQSKGEEKVMVDGEEITTDVVRHALPMHIPGVRDPISESGYGVLYLNELLTLDEEKQNQFREWLDWQIGDIPLSRKWRFIADSNPPQPNMLTVKAWDNACEERLCPIICVKPSSDDALAFWRREKAMPEQVYTFLLMHQDFIKAVSPRRWTNLGHSIYKWLRSGRVNNTVVHNLLAVNIQSEEQLSAAEGSADSGSLMGDTIASAFIAFLQRGSDPSMYPILGSTFLQADKDSLSTMKKRLTGWIRGGDDALLGATRADLCLTLRDVSFADLTQLKGTEKAAAKKADDKRRNRMADNIAMLMELLCGSKYTDMADPILSAARSGSLQDDLLERLEGSPAAHQLVEARRRHAARRQDEDQQLADRSKKRKKKKRDEDAA